MVYTLFRIEIKAVNLALKMERDKNALLQKEKDELNPLINGKDDVILTLNHEIQNKQEELSEIKKELLLEKDRTNDILNIKVSDEELRQVYLDEAKQKTKKYDLLVRILKDFLPKLFDKCPEFIRYWIIKFSTKKIYPKNMISIAKMVDE